MIKDKTITFEYWCKKKFNWLSKPCGHKECVSCATRLKENR